MRYLYFMSTTGFGNRIAHGNIPFLLNQKWEHWNYLYSLGTTSVALELPLIEFSRSYVWTIFSVTIFGLISNKECLFHQDSVPGLFFFFFCGKWQIMHRGVRVDTKLWKINFMFNLINLIWWKRSRFQQTFWATNNEKSYLHRIALPEFSIFRWILRIHS